MIGASTRVEIWDTRPGRATWPTEEQDFADIEEGVLPGGLQS